MTPQEVRKLWAETLRSNRFKQGRGKLKHEDKYCCLGVLAELAVENNVIESYHQYDGFLPVAVREWAGLSSTSGSYYEGALTHDNDISKKTFAEIADIIESTPKEFLKGYVPTVPEKKV